MVRRNYNNEITSGIFKRLKKFPFMIEEMALSREKWGNDVSLIVYKKHTASDRTTQRRKTILFQFGREGMWLGYMWRASDFEIDEEEGHHAKVVGIDLV